MRLSDYGMSRERGFLSPYEIDDVFVPTWFDPVIETAERLGDLLSTGRVRHWLAQLPEPGIAKWAETAPDEQVRTMMVRYSFLVQAWVWGESEPPACLPANLARPIVALADRLGQAPLLPYSPTCSTTGRGSTRPGRSRSTTSAWCRTSSAAPTRTGS
jgi:indoleamine 2,3-dioxygenase